MLDDAQRGLGEDLRRHDGERSGRTSYEGQVAEAKGHELLLRESKSGARSTALANPHDSRTDLRRQ
jgi:hypothetical protein